MIYIALLRGINVGGHKKIKMEALRNSLETLHFKNLKTYIQSGNVVFQFKDVGVEKISSSISKKIKDDFGFDVPVIVKTYAELKHVFLNNPFINKYEIEKLYVAFLSTNPSNELIDKFGSFGEDKYVFVNDILYLCYAERVSDSKLTNKIIESKLNVIATSRNWKTVTQLVLMANDLN